MSSGVVRRRSKDAVWIAAALVVAGLVWSLLQGAPLANILLATLAGLAAGGLVGMLPRRLLGIAGVVGMIAILLWMTMDNPLAPATVAAYCGGLLFVGTWLGLRALAGVLAPALLRINWDDGPARNSLATPTWAAVQVRLQALDGSAHTMISLHRENHRLDVCCPEAGRYWVIHTGPGGKRPTVNQAFTGQPDTGGEVSARIGGMDFHYPDHLFVDLLTVLAAARWFWEFDGTRNPSLTWDQDTNRHEVLIPPPLGELDN